VIAKAAPWPSQVVHAPIVITKAPPIVPKIAPAPVVMKKAPMVAPALAHSAKIANNSQSVAPPNQEQPKITIQPAPTNDIIDKPATTIPPATIDDGSVLNHAAAESPSSVTESKRESAFCRLLKVFLTMCRLTLDAYA
jgi:hypothetical protein